MPREIVIGDVHGCYDELCALLDTLAPAADDRIISVGDLVNRGPQTRAVLRFFRDTPQAVAIRGNNEHNHLLSARGRRAWGRSYTRTRDELGGEYAAWLDWFAQRPLYVELDAALIVHGAAEPDRPAVSQREEVLLGLPAGEALLADRLGSPWYAHYAADKPLICGHHHYRRDGQPLIRPGQVYAIDTGCVHGYRLTALVLPGFDVVSVAARRDYWSCAKAGLRD